MRLMWFITSISFLSAMCHPGHFILKIYICEFNMWPVSAERMPTCVVWEIKVFGLLKATIKSQQGRQRTDKQRLSLPLSLHLLSLSHVSHVFFSLNFLTSRTGFVCENKALGYKSVENLNLFTPEFDLAGAALRKDEVKQVSCKYGEEMTVAREIFFLRTDHNDKKSITEEGKKRKRSLCQIVFVA